LNLTGREFSFNEIRIGAGVGETMDVDEFRLGTTFASVTPSAIPEPATWTMMLLGFASLGMIGGQSSRKKAAKASLGQCHLARKDTFGRLFSFLRPCENSPENFFQLKPLG
jgi:hypothetical protein